MEMFFPADRDTITMVKSMVDKKSAPGDPDVRLHVASQLS
jgi:hypothetical protein